MGMLNGALKLRPQPTEPITGTPRRTGILFGLRLVPLSVAWWSSSLVLPTRHLPAPLSVLVMVVLSGVRTAVYSVHPVTDALIAVFEVYLHQQQQRRQMQELQGTSDHFAYKTAGPLPAQPTGILANTFDYDLTCLAELLLACLASLAVSRMRRRLSYAANSNAGRSTVATLHHSTPWEDANDASYSFESCSPRLKPHATPVTVGDDHHTLHAGSATRTGTSADGAWDARNTHVRLSPDSAGCRNSTCSSTSSSASTRKSTNTSSRTIAGNAHSGGSGGGNSSRVSRQAQCSVGPAQAQGQAPHAPVMSAGNTDSDACGHAQPAAALHPGPATASPDAVTGPTAAASLRRAQDHGVGLANAGERHPVSSGTAAATPELGQGVIHGMLHARPLSLANPLLMPRASGSLRLNGDTSMAGQMLRSQPISTTDGMPNVPLQALLARATRHVAAAALSYRGRTQRQMFSIKVHSHPDSHDDYAATLRNSAMHFAMSAVSSDRAPCVGAVCVRGCVQLIAWVQGLSGELVPVVQTLNADGQPVQVAVDASALQAAGVLAGVGAGVPAADGLLVPAAAEALPLIPADTLAQACAQVLPHAAHLADVDMQCAGALLRVSPSQANTGEGHVPTARIPPASVTSTPSPSVDLSPMLPALPQREPGGFAAVPSMLLPPTVEGSGTACQVHIDYIWLPACAVAAADYGSTSQPLPSQQHDEVEVCLRASAATCTRVLLVRDGHVLLDCSAELAAGRQLVRVPVPQQEQPGVMQLVLTPMPGSTAASSMPSTAAATDATAPLLYDSATLLALPAAAMQELVQLAHAMCSDCRTQIEQQQQQQQQALVAAGSAEGDDLALAVLCGMYTCLAPLVCDLAFLLDLSVHASASNAPLLSAAAGAELVDVVSGLLSFCITNGMASTAAMVSHAGATAGADMQALLAPYVAGNAALPFVGGVLAQAPLAVPSPDPSGTPLPVTADAALTAQQAVEGYHHTAVKEPEASAAAAVAGAEDTSAVQAGPLQTSCILPQADDDNRGRDNARDGHAEDGDVHGEEDDASDDQLCSSSTTSCSSGGHLMQPAKPSAKLTGYSAWSPFAAMGQEGGPPGRCGRDTAPVTLSGAPSGVSRQASLQQPQQCSPLVEAAAAAAAGDSLVGGISGSVGGECSVATVVLATSVLPQQQQLQEQRLQQQPAKLSGYSAWSPFAAASAAEHSPEVDDTPAGSAVEQPEQGAYAQGWEGRPEDLNRQHSQPGTSGPEPVASASVAAAQSAATRAEGTVTAGPRPLSGYSAWSPFATFATISDDVDTAGVHDGPAPAHDALADARNDAAAAARAASMAAPVGDFKDASCLSQVDAGAVTSPLPSPPSCCTAAAIYLQEAEKEQEEKGVKGCYGQQSLQQWQQQRQQYGPLLLRACLLGFPDTAMEGSYEVYRNVQCAGIGALALILNVVSFAMMLVRMIAGDMDSRATVWGMVYFCLLRMAMFGPYALPAARAFMSRHREQWMVLGWALELAYWVVAATGWRGVTMPRHLHDMYVPRRIELLVEGLYKPICSQLRVHVYLATSLLHFPVFYLAMRDLDPPVAQVGRRVFLSRLVGLATTMVLDIRHRRRFVAALVPRLSSSSSINNNRASSSGGTSSKVHQSSQDGCSNGAAGSMAPSAHASEAAAAEVDRLSAAAEPCAFDASLGGPAVAAGKQKFL